MVNPRYGLCSHSATRILEKVLGVRTNRDDQRASRAASEIKKMHPKGSSMWAAMAARVQTRDSSRRNAASEVRSHKPISEKRKSRDFGEPWASPRRNCPVMHRYIAIYITLLVQVFARVHSNGASATSHINSIWISTDELQREQLKQISPLNKTHEFISQNSNGEASNLRRSSPRAEAGHNFDSKPTRPSERRTTLPILSTAGPIVQHSLRANHSQPAQANRNQSTLTVAASSLQPSVVAVDPEHGVSQSVSRRTQPTAQRRSSVSEPRFKLAHVNTTFSDEASSLDHLWNGAQQRAQPNATSNAEVQFDEEQHHQQQLHEQHSRRRQLPKPLQDYETTRRQDNETTLSNLAPKHADFAHDEIHYDEPTIQPNATRLAERPTPPTVADDDLDDPPPPGNFTSVRSGPQVADLNEQHKSGLEVVNYYPQEGIKWIPDRAERDNRPHYREPNVETAHSSHGGHLFERHANSSHTPDPSTMYQLNGAHRELQPMSDLHGQLEVAPRRDPKGWSSAGIEQANPKYGFVPNWQDVHAHEMEHANRAKSYSLANSFANNAFPALYYSHNRDLRQPSANTQRLYPTTMLPQYTPSALTSRPRSLHKALTDTAHYDSFMQPLKRSRPVRSEVVNQGHKLLFARGQRPQQTGYQSKPKKSLFSSLNEKINHWTAGDSLGVANNRDELRLLEHAFFEPSNLERPTLRPLASSAPAFLTPGRFIRPQSDSGNFQRFPMHQNGFYGPIRQPTVAPATSSLNRFYPHAHRQRHHQQQAGTRVKPRGVQQQGSQQQASFIPVVAVQVTRTSPAPNPMSGQQQSKMLNVQQQQQARDSLISNSYNEMFGGQTSANQIEQYLASKVAQGNAHYNANERQKWDDSYGGSMTTGQRLAGASLVASPHYQLLDEANSGLQHKQPPRVAIQQSQPQHETTVKGAVFGFLPHQADAPLMQAMSVLQQLPQTTMQQRQPHRSHPSQLDVYANQMDKSSQAVDAATSLFDYQSLAGASQPTRALLIGANEQPSLALQLQANSFVQNDIAHPFSSDAAASNSESLVDQRLSSPKVTPLELIYPSQQLQYPGYQFLAPSQLGGAYQDQMAQLLANPLLAAPASSASNSVSQLDQYQSFLQSAPSTMTTQPMLAAASPGDLSSLLASSGLQNPAHQFHPIDSFYDTSKTSQRPATDENASSGLEAADQSEPSQADSSRQPQQTEAAPSETINRHQTLNNKGKKRSSEFFANAGQLLLSALPLLLAPTLGLMFAASPAIPAARYHGLGQLPASHSSGLFGGPNKMQGHDGASSHDDGVVMNASPAQMFTPNPQDDVMRDQGEPVQSYGGLRFSAQSNQSWPVTDSPLATTTPTVTTTSTSSRPIGFFKSSASLPALTGFKMTPAKPQTSSRPANKSQSTPKPFAVFLTTLGPALNLSANSAGTHRDSNEAERLATSSSNSSHSIGEPIELSNTPDETTIITPTLLLVEAQTDDETENHSSPASNQSSDGGDSRVDNPSPTRSNSSSQSEAGQNQHVAIANLTTTRSPASVAYDIGYQGADFDAQFPTLRRSISRQPLAGLNKFVKNKSHYQYDDLQTGGAPSSNFELASLPTVETSQKNSSRHDFDGLAHSMGENDQDGGDHSTKLYPVSTWPPFRRRTVSLVTSRGNTTLVDASSSERRHLLNRLLQKSEGLRFERDRRRNSKVASSDEPDPLRQDIPSLDGEQKPAASFSARALAKLGINQTNKRNSRSRRRKRETQELQLAPTQDNVQANSSGAKVVPLVPKRRKSKHRKRRHQTNRRHELHLTQASESLPVNSSTVDLDRPHDAPRQPLSANEASPEGSDREPTEQLARDASKRKSAIVTAMITQVASGDNDQDEPAGESAHRNGEMDPTEEAQLAHEELRAQLVAKKALLDQIASRAAASNEIMSDAPVDEIDNFRLGGRGHFKPAPVGEHAQLLDQPHRNYSATRFVSGRSRFGPKEQLLKANTIELNEKTKQALAKFGSLLLEDTFQIPAPRNESSGGRGLSRSKYSVELQTSRANATGSYDQQEGSATERYPMRAMTRPGQGDSSHRDSWSSYYADRNQTRGTRANEPGNRSEQSLVYQYPQSRARHRQHESGHYASSNDSDWDSRNDRFESARHKPSRAHEGQPPSGGVNGHAYPAASTISPQDDYSGGGSQAVAFKQASQARSSGPDSTLDRYNHFLGQQRANRSGEAEVHTNSTGEQLDARYSSYTNYSTASPALYGDPSGSYRGHYDGYAHNGRHHDQGPPPPPPGYYSEDQPPHNYHYERQPYFQNQSNSYGGQPPAQPQNHRPLASSYSPAAYQPNHRHGPPPEDYPPPSMHYQHQQHYSYPPPPPQAPYRPPPPPETHGSHPSSPSRYPNVQAAVYNQPSRPYSPAYNADDYQNSRHVPSSSTYAPSSSSLAAQPAYGSGPPAPNSRATPTNDRAPIASRTAAADSSRSINDYLKRAQFSDSDRDKLMASYLTCDGLLHDNDHCLERLSCEFSDPKNIEKANKLDRAVSSILLGHILINTYIPNAFKLRLKSASLFGFTQSGKCSKFACNKLAKQSLGQSSNSSGSDEERLSNEVEARR